LNLLELECVGDSGAARLALSPASSASRHRPPGRHHHEIPFETKPSRVAVEDDLLHLTPSPATDAAAATAALVSNTTYVRSRESAQRRCTVSFPEGQGEVFFLGRRRGRKADNDRNFCRGQPNQIVFYGPNRFFYRPHFSGRKFSLPGPERPK
jgi:hypothetical protein